MFKKKKLLKENKMIMKKNLMYIYIYICIHGIQNYIYSSYTEFIDFWSTLKFIFVKNMPAELIDISWGFNFEHVLVAIIIHKIYVRFPKVYTI